MEPVFLVTRRWKICNCSQLIFSPKEKLIQNLTKHSLLHLIIRHCSFILYALKKVPLHMVPVKAYLKKFAKKLLSPFFIYVYCV